jgi:hypothetical protein
MPERMKKQPIQVARPTSSPITTTMLPATRTHRLDGNNLKARVGGRRGRGEFVLLRCLVLGKLSLQERATAEPAPPHVNLADSSVAAAANLRKHTKIHTVTAATTRQIGWARCTGRHTTDVRPNAS